jgi:acyl-coenzyme A synthetase/AMP-(fatty) acid ligase
MNMAVKLELVNIPTVISSVTMTATEALTDGNLARLSNVNVDKTSAALIICTSGTTGKPKIVEHTHGSLTYFLHSLTEDYLFRSTDNILQLASCQWTTHAWEITVSLCFGSTLVLLHPGGQLDIDYLMRTMTKKQISALNSLPSTARLLAEHLATKSDGSVSCFRSLRAYSMGGELSDYFSFFLKRPTYI